MCVYFWEIYDLIVSLESNYAATRQLNDNLGCDAALNCQVDDLFLKMDFSPQKFRSQNRSVEWAAPNSTSGFVSLLIA